MMSNYNKCEGCKLWNGHHCTGARSYEPNADEHKAICNEHMAEQFWVVSKQLYNAEARVKELKEKYEEIKEDRYNLNMEMYTFDRYRKALDEIEKYIKKYECDNCEDYVFGCGDCGTPRDILDILNKATDRKNEN